MAALAAINAYLSEQPPMARQSIKVTLGGRNSDTPGVYTPEASPSQPIVTATVAADVATLVADGATPTQGHVTTLNTDWTAFLLQIGGDVQVTWDTTKITTVTQLKRAFDAALTAAAGGGILTP